MKRLLSLLALTLCGCGDLFDGFRIGTGNSESTGTDPLPWVATYRDTASLRFPGDPDPIALLDTVGAEDPLLGSAVRRGWCLSLWSLDSSRASWEKLPGRIPSQPKPTRVVEIRLVDSVSKRRVELSLPGLGRGSEGSRPDSVTTVHSFRTIPVIWTLALRWPDGKRADIDSIVLGDGWRIDLSPLADAVDGCRAAMGSDGRIAVDSKGSAVCR